MEPATPAECLAITRFAFELSEAVGNLVVLRSVSRLSHNTRADVTPGELPAARPRPAWNPKVRWFTVPVVPRQPGHARQVGQSQGDHGHQRLQPL